MKKNIVSHLAVIILAGLACYSNSFNSAFQFDDNAFILANPIVIDVLNPDVWRTFLKTGHLTRSLSFLTLGLNYHVHQADVMGFHVINVLIHLINGCLVYFLVGLILKSPAMISTRWAKESQHVQLIASLIFVCHPLQTQAVTYVYQRLASQATLFYLLSICSFCCGRIKSGSNRSVWFVISFVSALLGMLSKEIVFTLPIMIYLTDIYFFGKANKKSYFKYVLVALMPLIPLLAYLSGLKIFAPRVVRAATHEVVNSWTYLLTQINVIVYYVRLLFIPVQQNLDYNIPVTKSLMSGFTSLNLLVLMAIASLAWKTFRKHRLISYGICWFFVTLMVESSIIPIRYLMVEHRLYLPMPGFAMLVSGLIFYAVKQRKTAVRIGLILASVLGVLTYQRNKVWYTQITMWEDVVKKNSGHPYSHFALASAYQAAGKYDLAVKHYELTLDNYDEKQKLIDIELLSKVHNNLGIISALSGEEGRALAYFQKAVEYRPDYSKALANIGNIYIGRGDYENAILYLSKSLELTSYVPETHFLLGKALIELGEDARAQEAFLTARDLYLKMDLLEKVREIDQILGKIASVK